MLFSKKKKTLTGYAGKGYVAFRKKVSETITFTLTVIDEDTIPEPSLYITMHFSQARNNIQSILSMFILFTLFTYTLQSCGFP